MAIAFEYLAVPRGDKAVYGLAEAYFVERLTAHFRPIGYDCYREYAYAGGSTLMPTVPTVSHTARRKHESSVCSRVGTTLLDFVF